MWITIRETCEQRYGISRTTHWRWVKIGRLPEPIEIGPGCKRHNVATLDEHDAKWFAKRGEA